VRGKIRDKRTDARQDRFKRDIIERRRPPRHENRARALQNRQLQEAYLEIDEDELDNIVAKKKN
jgi:putative aminopeptidase FrvX